MKLTCVTAVFNAVKSGNRDRLIKCVESVAKLKTEHEHLIYDGASTDGTIELLRELECRTIGLKVFSEPDTGIYNALNKGIRDAKGEWFYVLGCDDYICNPELMDKIISELNNDCDIFATAVVYGSADGLRTTLSIPCLTDIYNRQCACHQGEIMRTRVARELRGFDEQYQIAADSDMFFKAHLARYKFKYDKVAFATNVCVGVSSLNSSVAAREHRISVANVLNLPRKERDLLINKKVLSFMRCIRLWNCGDAVVYRSARTMFWRRIKRIIRFCLYPLVVLSRPLRKYKFMSID